MAMIYKTFTTQMNNFIISLLRDNFNLPVEIGSMICEYRSANFKDIIKKLDDDDHSFLWWKIHYMSECADFPSLREITNIANIDEMEEAYKSDVGRLWRLMCANETDRLKVWRFIYEHLDGNIKRYATIRDTYNILNFNFDF